MKGKHTSLDKHLRDNIKWIENLPNVNKVVLGFTEACRHRFTPGKIKFKMNVPGGIKVNGYSGKGVVDIFIRVNPIDKRTEVLDIILSRFGS